MKNTVLIIVAQLCFATFIIPTSAQNLKTLDDKNGFRELKFGTDINEFQNMKLTEASKDSLRQYYIKTDDKLQIGKYDVEIFYGFYKQKFYYVVIKTKGSSNSKGILAVLRELYGNGNQPNQYMEEFYWWGKIVTATYKENSITNDALIFFSNNNIREQEEKDTKEAQKKAKGDM